MQESGQHHVSVVLSSANKPLVHSGGRKVRLQSHDWRRGGQKTICPCKKSDPLPWSWGKHTTHCDTKVSRPFSDKFKVCKSVNHHTFQINQQDTTISQVYYLKFMYSSTCFGRPHVYHQELNNCSSSLWFYFRSVVVAVLLVVVEPTGPTTTNSTAITRMQGELTA
jgi:hypothetical protein